MKKRFLAIAMICGLCCLGVVTPVVAGNDWDEDICNKLSAEQKKDYGCDVNNPDAENVVVNIINIVTGVAGIVAVLMIVIGGVNYATSAGDPGKAKKAKDTILYSAIGLVVAVSAFALVNFVLKGVFK